MGSLQLALRDRLGQDPTIVGAPPAALGFGVYDRWLTPTGPGAVKEAFTDSGKLRRSIVILEPDEVASGAQRPGWGLQRAYAGPILYCFAEAHASGREALEQLYRRAVLLLNGWTAVLDNGERPLIEVADGRSGARDDESFPGNLRTEIRLRANWLRSLS